MASTGPPPPHMPAGLCPSPLGLCESLAAVESVGSRCASMPRISFDLAPLPALEGRYEAHEDLSLLG